MEVMKNVKSYLDPESEVDPPFSSSELYTLQLPLFPGVYIMQNTTGVYIMQNTTGVYIMQNTTGVYIMQNTTGVNILQNIQNMKIGNDFLMDNLHLVFQNC